MPSAEMASSPKLPVSEPRRTRQLAQTSLYLWTTMTESCRQTREPMNIQLGQIAFAVASLVRLSNAAGNTDYGAWRLQSALTKELHFLEKDACILNVHLGKLK